MRRLALAFVAVVASGAFFAPIAAAATWSRVSTDSANRLGYTQAAPESFTQSLPSVVRSIVGSSYDLTSTPSLWAAQDETDSNGWADFNGTGAHDYLSRTNSEVITVNSGESFAWVYAYGHLKDYRLSGATGQYAVPYVNGAQVKTWTVAPFYHTKSVPGNDLGDPWGGYNIGSASASGTSTAATDDMPSGRYQALRTAITVAGIWHEASGTWRVHTACVVEDATHAELWSVEQTVTPAGGHTHAGVYLMACSDGYTTEYRDKDGGRVERVKTSGTVCTNVEWQESALTTDVVAAQAIYNRSGLSERTFDGSPTDLDAASDGADTGGDSDPIGLNKYVPSWVREKLADLKDYLGGLVPDLFWPLRFFDDVQAGRLESPE